MADPKPMSAGKRAYEERQARKAGKPLDAWLAEKNKRQETAARPAAPPPAPKKPGLISRLLDRAHKPL